MYGTTQGGNDILTVNSSANEFSTLCYGDASLMYDSAHGGNDILKGGNGPDTLYGDANFYSPSTPGSITGGRDMLDGGGGHDQLWGGPNNDTFKFDLGSGNDIIFDFNQGNLAVGSTATEHDIIDVHSYGFANWNALAAVIHDDSGGNAVIHLSANDTITLTGVQTAHLHASDFIV
jgi:Ca2+-binding RTX toxin-like protein